jgi:ribose transport system substrate-binding protein
MPRRMLFVLAALTVGLAFLVASASGGGAAPSQHQTAKKTYTIYLVAGIASDAFYLTMKKGAQAAGKKLGVKVVFTGSTASFSPNTQIPFLNGAIARHPDAILIAPTDKTALIAPIQRAISAGIPVITVDTFITKPIAVTNVSTDNVGGGRAAADALAKAIGGSGDVGAISVNPGISTTDQRAEGFAAQLKAKYPNIKYLGIQYCNDDQTKASNQTSALMNGHPNLKGIFAMNVVSGNGVTSAVTAAGKSGQVKLVEFDAGPPQVQALKAGTIDALVAQYPYGIGQLGVQLAFKYITGHRTGIKKHYGTGSAVVTKANVNSPAIKKYLYTP